jgi:LysM repeat protein
VILSKLNDLKNKRVTPGQTLQIPQASDQLPEKVLLAAARVDRPGSDASGRKRGQIVYRVRTGDTLTKIAQRQGITVSTLARLNNLGAGDTVVQGPAPHRQGELEALS